MAFPIELLTTENDLVQVLQSAIEPLNRVQTTFRFELANERILKEKSFYFKRDTYNTDDIFNWLQSFRNEEGGYRPFIILVTRAYLKGRKYENIFGTHHATEGLAVFTTDAFHKRIKNQFLFDQVRYCQYYLVRYSLSFVAPEIRNHQSNGCMFDQKDYRPDIRLSLDTGKICSACEGSLKSSSKCNVDVYTALQDLLSVVSNQRPRALVMKGGGVKGLALVGAMKELEKYFTFDTFSGTSAGAIAAVLLGAGYSPTELERIFREKRFKDFLDKPWKVPFNLVSYLALHSGNHIEDWIGELLEEKIDQQSRILMENLNSRTIIYATRRGDGPLIYDSRGKQRDEVASFAVRCSMSIPFFFRPKMTGGIMTYDGGLGNNFPLRKFIEDNNKELFIGLYLKSKIKKRGSLISDLIDIAIDSDERGIVDRNKDKIVIIDPFPVKTTQFSLTENEKDFLVLAGKVGALRYISEHHKDLQIDPSSLRSLENDLALSRSAVISLKRKRKWRKLIMCMLVLGLILAIYFLRDLLFF